MPDLERKKRHVVNVEIDGFKGIDHLTFQPSRTITVIGGKNGSGKSSALDAIDTALRGGRSIPGEPVNHNRKKATIAVGLEDDIEVRWTKTKAGAPSLVISSPDVEKYDSPRALLTEALGIQLGMDPLEFADRYDVKRQVETAMGILGLTDTLEQFQTKRDRLFTDRTDLNRDVKSLTTRAEAILVPEGTPDEEPDVSAMVKAQVVLQEAKESLSVVTRHEQEITRIEDQIKALKVELSRAKDGRILATQMLEEKKEAAVEACVTLGIDPGTEDANEALSGQIAGANGVAAAVRNKHERAALQAELEEKKAEADELTRTIEKLDAERDRTVQEVDLPVDGLEFAEDGLRYNGTPFPQASRAEQLTVSCALAVAANPMLPLVLIRDGSLLDDDHLVLLEDLAEKNECQFLIEMATRDDRPDDRVSIMLTNGQAQTSEV